MRGDVLLAYHRGESPIGTSETLRHCFAALVVDASSREPTSAKIKYEYNIVAHGGSI